MIEGFATNPLRRADGCNRFCGPFVVASILGVSRDEGARAIRDANWRSCRFGGGVKGTYDYEIRKTLESVGFEMRSFRPADFAPERTTLRRFVVDSAKERADRLVLVSAGRHWRLLWRGQYACGLVGEPVCWSKAPNLGSRVRAAWLIHPLKGGDR